MAIPTPPFPVPPALYLTIMTHTHFPRASERMSGRILIPPTRLRFLGDNLIHHSPQKLSTVFNIWWGQEIFNSSFLQIQPPMPATPPHHCACPQILLLHGSWQSPGSEIQIFNCNCFNITCWTLICWLRSSLSPPWGASRNCPLSSRYVLYLPHVLIPEKGNNATVPQDLKSLRS